MRIIDRTKPLFVAAALAGGALVASGCGGAAISPQLADARSSMAQAQRGLAGELQPDQLLKAQRLIRMAEEAPNGSAEQQHYAYLGERQIRIAVAEATGEHVQRQTRTAQDSYLSDLESAAISRERALVSQTDELSNVQQEMERVRSQLQAHEGEIDETTRALQQRQAELAAREAELMAEREARQAAEQRASEAMAELAELAEVREQQNQTIITLSGEILFESGQAELRPNARQRLETVANALAAQSPERPIVIEGHTDSRGSDDFNRDLSQRRAEAVRRFLVEHGVPEEHLQAVGQGESEPIANNRSPEGRANNRRVEIVIGAPGRRTAQR